MKFDPKENSVLFSNTEVPDVFFSEYLPVIDGDTTKVYLYICFLAKHEKDVSINDISKILSLPYEKVENAIKALEDQGLLLKKPTGYIITDLQEKELNKVYSPKVTSSTRDIEKSENNKERTEAIESINDQFFQGLMSPSWYTDIDFWFEKYGFDNQVMVALFSYCAEKKALHRNYIQAVATTWSQNGIKTYEQLDEYFLKQEKLNGVKKEISKALRLNRPLNAFEEEYINKWTEEYGYGMDIINLALKRSTTKSNVGFDYYNKILKDWHEKGLTTVEDVNNQIKSYSEKGKRDKQVQKKAEELDSFTQSTFDNLYDN